MIESKNLELTTSLTIGTLTTNAASIKAFVDEQLKNYTPDLYDGRADDAKHDRAELNKAADSLNKKRQEIEKEFNKPFEEFKTIINGAVKSIKAASAELDAIVKNEEQKEKDKKHQAIADIWAAKNFELVSLEKIFNPKWLNKTTKLTAISAEIDTITGSILNDLEIINNFDEQDVPLIKSVYLDTLSLSDAAQYAETLKANREKLAKEKQARQAHAVNIQLEEQRNEERAERRADAIAEVVAPLNFENGQLVESIEVEEPEPLESYALLFSGTHAQLTCLKEYMTRAGISYSKLSSDGDGCFYL